MVVIKLETNASDVSRAFGHLAYREVPYATARALNATAGDVRDAGRAEMRRVFTIRSQRVPQAVRLQNARKQDRPIRAYVGLLSPEDAFLAPHALGAWKKPRPGARRLAIPTALVKRGGSGKVPLRQKPGSLLSPQGKRRGYFVPEDERTIEQRPPNGKRSLRLRQLGTATWYLLRARAYIRKDWDLETVARREAGRVYQPHFNRWLLVAVNQTRTAVPNRLGRYGPFLPGR